MASFWFKTTARMSALAPAAWVLLWLVGALSIQGLAYAVPVPVTAPDFAKLSQGSERVRVDARQYWQSAIVGVKDLPTQTPSSTETLWNTPDAEFQVGWLPKRLQLSAGQRYVARLNLPSPTYGNNMHLVFNMPRLDAVHVAYRYGSEPWVMASAGDTIAMNKWAFSDRQPSFDIPIRPGNLNVVAEIAHIGVVDAPIELQSSSTFRDARLSHGLVTGALIGVNLIFMLIGITTAFTFRRSNFLAVSLMTALVAVAVSAVSGMLGIYMQPDSATFNDEAKFFSLTAWSVVFPLITAVVLAQRQYAPVWWYAAVAYAVLGMAFNFAFVGYDMRVKALQWIPMVALASVLVSLAITVHAFMRKQPFALAMGFPIVLYAVALMLPFAAYMGYMLNEDATMLSAVITMLAAMLFFQALVRQYRQGRMVMSRAKFSPARDALTGLLSRQGFEQMLARNVQRMKSERTFAAFLYIRVSEPRILVDRYGAEGFETGMVQMAAAISSSISVVDTVGRVAPNAFAVMILMPHDPKTANQLVQKILTRIMSLATHGAPMAQSAQIAAAWMPIFGIDLSILERRADRALRKMDDAKRITWIGGVQAHVAASQLSTDYSDATTKPHNGQQSDEALPSLPGVIDRLEEEMLGPTTEQLQEEVQRMGNLLKQSKVLQPTR
jgi:diguanylate cyclase (GGDEF)-like protein